jgi:uncharacterized protein YdcH (DUF465 family)
MPVQNAEIASMFDHIADLLEIKGENPFRVRAYRRAARVVEGLPQGVASLVKSGRDLSELPGIGKDLAVPQTRKEAAMTRIPHELPEEFPGEIPLIERLTSTDPQFQKLAASYNDINRAIHRMEAGDAHTPEEVVVTARKRRLKIKDEIATMLARAKSA